ncbi:MAG: hypothetical protein FWC18_03130 [Cystobacterineae bacterium]|nr:hypothetical protein [Cystobacterineae bacterium]
MDSNKHLFISLFVMAVFWACPIGKTGTGGPPAEGGGKNGSSSKGEGEEGGLGIQLAGRCTEGQALCYSCVIVVL